MLIGLKPSREFYIGGYQPAQKWLKDRKGRVKNSKSRISPELSQHGDVLFMAPSVLCGVIIYHKILPSSSFVGKLKVLFVCTLTKENPIIHLKVMSIVEKSLLLTISK